jgi:hypothetical protein
MLSRTPKANLIYIVGEEQDALERLWAVLCKRKQWTEYMESIINNWSIEGDGVVTTTDNGILDLDDVFPYKLCNVTIPDSNSGFVYMLISVISSERIYVGQTENLGIRLVQHNSGYGSSGTAPPAYLPYAPAAYLTNMSHLNQSGRMMLEAKWQKLNERSLEKGEANVHNLIQNGRRVMDEYNIDASPENHLRFVICIKRTSSVVHTKMSSR